MEGSMISELMDYGLAVAVLVALTIGLWKKNAGLEQEIRDQRAQVADLAAGRTEKMEKMTNALNHLNRTFGSELQKIERIVSKLVEKLEQ
jgi:hypothetical protein